MCTFLYCCGLLSWICGLSGAGGQCATIDTDKLLMMSNTLGQRDRGAGLWYKFTGARVQKMSFRLKEHVSNHQGRNVLPSPHRLYNAKLLALTFSGFDPS